MDGDPALLEVHVALLQQADFGCAEAVAVGKEEEGPVALVLNHGKQPLHLLLGEKVGDLVAVAYCELGGFGLGHVIRQNNRFCAVSEAISRGTPCSLCS